jgi:hypothetical protein
VSHVTLAQGGLQLERKLQSGLVILELAPPHGPRDVISAGIYRWVCAMAGLRANLPDGPCSERPVTFKRNRRSRWPGIRKNVVDSDGTAIIYFDSLKGGTRLTRNLCALEKKAICPGQCAALVGGGSG